MLINELWWRWSDRRRSNDEKITWKSLVDRRIKVEQIYIFYIGTWWLDPICFADVSKSQFQAKVIYKFQPDIPWDRIKSQFSLFLMILWNKFVLFHLKNILVGMCVCVLYLENWDYKVARRRRWRWLSKFNCNGGQKDVLKRKRE